jgi:2-iminobutanoate/2-iminopropanoate deaminase
MKSIQTPNAPAAIGPYSQAMIANGMVFTSGQIALTPSGEMLEGDVKVQCTQVLANLKAVLEASGSSLDKVLKRLSFWQT